MTEAATASNGVLFGKSWGGPPSSADLDGARSLAQEAGLTLTAARLLRSRGFADAAAVRAFLQPRLDSLHSPLLLKGMEEAVARIRRALRASEPVWIFGDYDVDGTAGTALLADFFSVLGKPARTHIPNRNDGYGLSVAAMRRLAGLGAKVVITVDNGISAHEVAREARSLGIDLVITDHHESKEGLPEAAAVIDPKQPGCAYPNKGLCGAGLAFKLAWGIAQGLSDGARVRDDLREFLMEAVGLATLATVADVVPLVGENRVIVHHGLPVLERSRKPGFAALREVCRQRGASLTATDVAFQWAPRINAAGRLAGPEIALELLTTRDPARARELAAEIDRLNVRRRELDREATEQAILQALEAPGGTDGAIIVSSEAWHRGIVGIVAGRLVDEFGVPVVAISWHDPLFEKEGTGSVRGPEGVDLVAALDAASAHLVRHGGHARAAGLTIRRGEEGAFREAFREAVRSQGVPAHVAASPDMEVVPGELEPRLHAEVSRMAPFGAGNPRPLLSVTGAEVAGKVRTFGSRGDHLEFYLRSGTTGVRAISWRNGAHVGTVSRAGGPFDLLAHVGEREGRLGALEIEVVAMRLAAGRA
ncbi:MAG: single-stranded-DNA-specific exonuclease RecJ [Planctomycetes bacterium]|nr:single-stranded-DNA-specific exonuclease RecJ [Planctomycetota bacterium]